MVAIHEAVHHVKANNKAGYDVLKKFAKQYLELEGENVHSLLKEIKENRDAQGENLTPEELMEELVADTISSIASNEKAMQAFLKLDAKERVTLRRVLQSIAERVKSIASKLTGAESRVLLKDSDNLLTLAKEMNKALKDVGENDGAQKNTTQGGVKTTNIRFSKNTDDYPYNMQTVIKKYLSSVDMALLDNIEFTLQNKNVFNRYTISEISERLATDIKTILGIDVRGYKIAMNSNAIHHIEKRHGKNGIADKSMKNHNDLARVKYILDNYDDIKLLKNEIGEQRYSKEFRNKDDKPAPILVLSKKINGTYYVSTAVIENKYKKIWVVSARIGKNKSGDLTQAPDNSGSYLASRSTATNIISDESEKSNSFSSNDRKKSYGVADAEYFSAVENGDMDTAQKLVDEAAKRAGYVNMLWHQTDADFTEFNTDNESAGKYDSEMPTGIFLKSTNADIGLKGHKQMSLYVRTKKTLYFANRDSASDYWSKNIEGYSEKLNELKTINSQYKQLLDEAEKEEDLQYKELWNKRRKGVISESEYQDGIKASEKKTERILDEWSKVADNKRLEAKKLINKYLQTTDYDSIYLEVDNGSFGRSTDAIIVFNSEQVKSADPVTYDDEGNVIPLSERFNPDKKDIRYSYGDESVDFWGVLDPVDEAEAEVSELLRGYMETAGEILSKTRGVELKEGEVRKIANSILRKYTGHYNTEHAQRIELILDVAAKNPVYPIEDVAGEIAAVVKDAFTSSVLIQDIYADERAEVFETMRGFGKTYLTRDQLETLESRGLSLNLFKQRRMDKKHRHLFYQSISTVFW